MSVRYLWLTRSLTWALAVSPALLSAQAIPAAPATPSVAELRSGFASPPPQARLRCYWWWLNGNTDKATITNDLEQMKAKGFGGALLVDAGGADQEGNHAVPAGPAFGSPAWTELFIHALKEADRLGLEITLNIMSGWNLGGPGVKPEQASKVLTFSRTELPAGSPSQVQLAAPQSLNGFYRQIAVLAYPLTHGTALAPQLDDHLSHRTQSEALRNAATLRFRSGAARNEEISSSMPDTSAMLNDGVHGDPAPFAGDPAFADAAFSAVQDISASATRDGVLNWTPPPGDWEILRIGYTDSGAMVSTSSDTWKGLALDHLSRAAFTEYWNDVIEPLLAVAKPYRSLHYLATDSWELGGTNWTADFRQHFIELRGYDPVPWLPVVAGRIVEDRAQSTRFLTDLRRTVADLIVSEHYDVFAEKSREYGLGVEAESGGPHGAPLDALETFRNSAVPQTEFWSQSPHRRTDPERFFTKEAASAANIYGKHLVAQEGETSIGPQWSESLATDLKPSFDMAITEGMNRLVWHEFTSSPASSGVPGQEYFAGTHINPRITWWNASGDFFAYLNRAQYLMQQGTAVNDVLYFYGDNIPAFVRLKADDPAHVLPGYDYDVTNEDALLHTIRSDGPELIGPSGVRWRALVMPHTRRISLPVLERIANYVSAGGVVIGATPSSPTGRVDPASLGRFNELIRRMWGESCALGSHHVFGIGQIYCTDDAHAALQSMHIPPDAELVGPASSPVRPDSSAAFDYIHRRIGAVDLYFVRNASAQVSSHDVVFRAHSSEVEIWDALTGQAQRLTGTEASADGRTRLHLDLAPFGSTFIAFLPSRDPAVQDQAANRRAEPFALDHSWQVTFQAGRGVPADPIAVTDLKSWTEWPNQGVRFFSGTATYRAQVSAPAHEKDEAVLLRFTDVREIARVKINGHDAGTVWARPFEIRVDPWLKPGLNTVEIEVTNLWPNRIIGDLQPGVTERFTSTNITAYHAGSPLLNSGLIGPMQWLIER